MTLSFFSLCPEPPVMNVGQTKLETHVRVPARLQNHELIPPGTQTAEPEAHKLDLPEGEQRVVHLIK